MHTISGYSAYTDPSNLVNFVKYIRHQSVKVIIVHGDEEVKKALATKLEQEGLTVFIGW